MKDVFVLWSGGLDSTFLVEKNLIDGNSVTVGYAKLNNNEKKTEKELASIKKMLGIFKTRCPGTVRDLGVISEHLFNLGSGNLTLKQLPVWINSLLYLDRNYEEIQIGYTMNDDAISYIPDIHKIYDAYRGLMTRDMSPITFPLMKQKKADTLYLISDDIRKLIVFCEDERSDFCGTCHSCLRMKDTIRECSEWYGRDFSDLYPFGEKDHQIKLDFDPISIVSKEVQQLEKDS